MSDQSSPPVRRVVLYRGKPTPIGENWMAMEGTEYVRHPQYPGGVNSVANWGTVDLARADLKTWGFTHFRTEGSPPESWIPI